ncbi:uncharacterized protein PAC_06679 [Phialocephala subalpina]|uniref:Uncharacterized protein n=1 Tax=Phialocephala subalpina TaxID=576137 RepID=A0A1L7WVI8_9HELO|nr:uncharacterized protein PAC_06679 [Phialocephala subalpina]
MTNEPMMRRNTLPSLFDSAGMNFPLIQKQDTQDVPAIPRRSSKRQPQVDPLRLNGLKLPSPTTDLFVDPDSVICKRLYRERMAEILSGQEKQADYEYDGNAAKLTLMERRILKKDIGLDWKNPFLKPMTTTRSRRKSIEQMSPRYVEPASFFSDDDSDSDYSVNEDDELMSPIENPFDDNRFPLLSISSLENLVNNQIFANDVLDVFADMEVQLLITDIKNSKYVLVDNDHLRGKPLVFDLRPHEWEPSCFCAHCERFSSGVDYNEPHDLNYCPCPVCFMIRRKIKWAEEDRLHREAEARRRQVLA